MPKVERQDVLAVTHQRHVLATCKHAMFADSSSTLLPQFLFLLGRARLYVESTLWSHIRVVVIVMEDPPPQLADPPPPGWHPPKLHVTTRAALWSHV